MKRRLDEITQKFNDSKQISKQRENELMRSIQSYQEELAHRVAEEEDMRLERAIKRHREDRHKPRNSN